jgi:plastocyanin
MKRLAMIAVPLLLSIGSARAACTDAAAVASTRAAADVQCPCATASGHKPYVQCVARIARAAAMSGSLPRQCKAAVVRCARKSTCGAPGFVTCCRTTATGSTKCSVKSSQATCTAPRGGSACVGAVPSCCDSCSAGGCVGATTTTITSGATTTTTLAMPRTHTVMVGNGGALAFTPANLTIRAGDTVRWVWGSGGHSVVSGTNGNADNRFCSPSNGGCGNPPLSNMGAMYEHAFAQAGTFPYYCSVHFSLGMTGTIKVE